MTDRPGNDRPGNDRPAIERLYRDHGHVVLRRARELLRSEVEARDAVQDIFLSLLQRPGQLDGVTRITAWLYRATTHHCLNRLRNRRGRIKLLDALRPASSVESRGELLAQVRSLLAQLPEPLGEVAVYHHVDGMTYDEIAAILGCSRRQVGALLERLRAIVARNESLSSARLLWPQERES